VLVTRGLAERDAGGAVGYEADQASEVAGILVPLALMMIMLIVVMTAAGPMTTNILEEKQQRIPEVILSSVSPFQFMLGKLLGSAGVALTLAAVYLGGAVGVAWRYDMLGYVSPGTIAWFVVFCALGVLMYGALFTLAGSAVTNVKEAQAMLAPAMLLVMLPMFLLGVMLKYPSGALARSLSYFPLTSPTVTVMRMAVPPGLATWELVLAALLTLAGTLVVVWAAGRVFRIGMLTTSRPAAIAEALRWIIRS
jgi:ABC-2 type transport system permease protein